MDDAEHAIDLMAPNSIDCIFTSPTPPSTVDELKKLLIVFYKCKRVLKRTGRLWVNISNQYRMQDGGGIMHMAERFVLNMEKQGWINRDNLIWYRYPHDKSKQIDPLRFRHDWEDVYGFTHDTNAYFNDKLGIHTTSIIQCPIENKKKGEDFKSGFPRHIVEICLKSTTRANDVVLDPFCGSGVTGVVALSLGRHFIGIEIQDRVYCKKIERRLSNLVTP